MLAVTEPQPDAKEGIYQCDKKLPRSSSVALFLLEDFPFILLSAEHLDLLIPLALPVAALVSGCSSSSFSLSFTVL